MSFHRGAASLLGAAICVVVQPVAAGDAGNALFALFDVHRNAGRAAEAIETLTRLEASWPSNSELQLQVADGYVRMGRPGRAIAILESLGVTNLSHENRIRLAGLYESVGRKRDAYEAWRTLAREVDTPSRRGYVEDRLLALAGELNLLETLNAELERELAHGGTDHQVAALLVRVSIMRGDRSVAMDVARKYRFERAGEIASLKAQADMFRRLGDREAYALVTRSLVERDPANAVDHLRKLILNESERGDEKDVPRIRELLAELGHRDDRAANPQFEAGVFMLAGLTDEAISAYRRAIAAQPKNGENWLLLGALLCRKGLCDEAVALFQLLAREAWDDGRFAIAIDGILNAISPDQFASLDGQDVAVLRWARDSALQRLIIDDGRPYLYRLIEETASLTEGPRGSLAALDAAVSTRGPQRSSVLRELIGVVSLLSKQPKGLSAAYGQRLVALREALPPDVHMELGVVFLRDGLKFAALQSFERAADEAADASIRIRAAEELERNGLAENAATYYRLALTADPRNIEAIASLAALYERTGSRDPANDLYERGLSIVLRAQPLQGDRDAYGYRVHYEGLLRGYLATWPRNKGHARLKLDAVGKMFDTELELAHGTLDDRTGPEVLAGYRRLDSVGSFARRVAWATGHANVSDSRDEKLLAQFSRDESVRIDLARERLAWNRFPAAWRLQPQAGLDDERDMARRRALMDGHHPQMLKLAREWVQRGEPLRAARWARGKLDHAAYTALCHDVVRAMRERPELVQRALFEDSQLFGQIEAAAGERVQSERALMETLTDPRLEGDLAWYGAYGFTDYVASRLSPSGLLEWIRFLAEGRPSEQAQSVTPVLLKVWRLSLSQPLERPFALELFREVSLALRKRPGIADAQWVDEMSAALIVPQLHPANLEWSERLTRFWREETHQVFNYFEPVQLLAMGQVDAALDELAALDVKVAAQPDEKDVSKPAMLALHALFMPRHSEALKRRLELAPPPVRYVLFEARDVETVFQMIWKRPESATAALPERYPLLERRDEIMSLARAGDTTAATRALRSLWLEAAAKDGGHAAADPREIAYENILALPAGSGDSRSLFQALSLDSVELEDYLRPLDVRGTRMLHDFYELIAVALRREGKAAEATSLLERAMHDQSADMHTYSLWYTLAGGSDGPLEGLAGIADYLLAHEDALSPYLLLQIARAEARSGHVDRAVRAYRTLILRTLVAPPGGVRPWELQETPSFDGVLNARQMVLELQRMLPRHHFITLTEGMTRLLQPDFAEAPVMHQLYERFLMELRTGVSSESATDAEFEYPPNLSPFFAAYSQMLGET